jgi:FlaA1/EpsC-like NDP-sugar epimerase
MKITMHITHILDSQDILEMAAISMQLQNEHAAAIKHVPEAETFVQCLQAFLSLHFHWKMVV